MFEDLTTVLNILPYFINSFACGAVYLLIYRFTSHKSDDTDKDSYFIFLSMVCSFFINQALFFVSVEYKLPISIIVAVIAGIAFGLMSKSNWFNKVLVYTKIERTLRKGVYEEFLFAPNGQHVTIKRHGKSGSIKGLIAGMDENIGASGGLVVLECFYILNDSGDVCEEHPDDKIILNLDDCEEIIIGKLGN